MKTLQEVHPTSFIAVPRIWEKIHEKMVKIDSESGVVKAAILSWARHHGLQHYLNKINGCVLYLPTSVSDLNSMF